MVEGVGHVQYTLQNCLGIRFQHSFPFIYPFINKHYNAIS